MTDDSERSHPTVGSAMPADTKPSEAVVIQRKNKRLGTMIVIASVLALLGVVGGVAFTSLRGPSVPPSSTPAKAVTNR